jgi:hypothetical protein
MAQAEPRFIDVVVDAHEGLEEGCALRFKAEDEPRVVRRVRWYDERDRAVECSVSGWSSDDGGRAVPAMGVTIEDSSAGAAVMVWGGDWGVRLVPADGGAPFYEHHLRIAPEDVLA